MKIKHLFAVTLGMLLATSCSNELPVGQNNESLFDEIPEGMFEYRFALKGITPTRLSYADVALEEDEMILRTAKIVVFGQAAAGALTDTDKLVCVTDGRITNGNISFQITGTTSFYGAAKAAVLLISNHENSNLAELTLTPGVTTYKDVADKLESKGDAGADIQTKGLLQIGKSIDNVVPSAGKKLAVGSVNTKRPFARFDVKNEGMKALSITSLKVKSISNKFLVLTEKFPLDAIHTHEKSVSVPVGLNRPEDGSKPDPKLIPGVIYSYPGSASGADSPVLLVTGKLTTGAGKETILTDFEVPFAKEGTKLRIKTNIRYTLTLKATVDGIIADITESFAEWGTEEDASLSFVSDLDNTPTVAKIGTGLTLTGIASDGTLEFDGTTAQESYNFSIENLTAGTTVTASVGGESQAVEAVASYGEITHYVVKLTEKVKTTETPQAIKITGVAGATTEFSLEISHIGGAPVVKEMDYPLTGGTKLPAVKVGNLWWAPVNVGATMAKEAGMLFQYGRNTGWENASAAYNGAQEIGGFDLVKIEAIEDVPYVGNTEVPNPKYWFTPETKDTFDKEIAPTWAAVSDGTNNPCPAGWRIPTAAEYSALLTPDVIQKPTFNDGTATLTVGDKESLTFQYTEGYLNSSYRLTPGSIKRTQAYFWATYEGDVNTNAYFFDSNSIETGHQLSLAHCCFLRCVRDAS